MKKLYLQERESEVMAIKVSSDAVAFADLTLPMIERHRRAFMFLDVAPEPTVFVNGLNIDAQSLNVIMLIYDALSAKHQADFEHTVLRNPVKFANFLNRMWGWVS